MTSQSPESTCDGKDPVSYGVAEKILKKQKAKGRKATIYHCPFCRGWHVGGQGKIKHGRKMRRVR